MGVSWTKEQQQVIELRNRNILVSAAAGSGKTAVLVERIITRLIKDANPIDVDQLLIVTYTEAAASEMRERIRSAIEKQLEETPENVHLQRQATLIHSALITTIHSFCLSVIRNHFHVIDLDPGFRIGEEGELKLLKQDVLQQVLEFYYERGEQKFLEFVEHFATGRDDSNVVELILQIFEFSRSYPNPEEWLISCVKMYRVADLEELENTPLAKFIREYIRSCLDDAMEKLRLGITACKEPDGPYMYLKALEADMCIIENMKNATSLQALYVVSKGITWERLAPNRKKEISVELTELVKLLRGQVKDIVSDISTQYLYEEPLDLCKDMERSCPVVEVLVDLVSQFKERFEQEKRAKNIIDFGDMERFALQILTNSQDGTLVPSNVAKEYQQQFAEVMIDEYQDSNLIQEAILTSVSKSYIGEYNIFMVGDVKQSIYRFRLSRPELFMEKFHSYSVDESYQQRIDLHKNFRSRREVLDSVNNICEQIMTSSLGGVAYDEKAALYVGADYKEQKGNETEVLVVHTDVESEDQLEVEETVRELEARAVARRIKELLAKQQVLDKKTGIYRKAQYRDIVILTRSLKGWTDVFSEVLNREGIPTYTGSKEGYFSTQEITGILDYLKVLDNPKQDLALTSVLTSMFGGIRNEELATIKCAFPEMFFYQAVEQYAKEGKDQLLKEKLQVCLAQIDGYRKAVPYLAIHQLLWKIIEETGYGYYIAALPGGSQRKANLDMLIEKAMIFETTSYKGLFNFVRYMEQLQKYNVDYGEANIEDERSNTVRLMSIHKSKGLEFPIVFVAGMSKRFNTQDTKGHLVIHPEFGIGIDAIDLEKRTKIPTLVKKVIQKKVQLENLGEELRVLYVALTRAKEKLIMVGTVQNFEEKKSMYCIAKQWPQRQLPFTMLMNANCYYDWVLPALLRTCNGILWKDITLTELVAKELNEEITTSNIKEQWGSIEATVIYNKDMKSQLERQLRYEYPYEQEQQFQLKMTVSELKKRAYMVEDAGELILEEPDVIPLLPKFLMKQEEVQGAARGSAYHKVMELIDFRRDYSSQKVEDYLREMNQRGLLQADMQASIAPQDILRFLQSDIGYRMQKAAKEEKLYVEQPFVLGIGADEIYHIESQEMILIQGIIDVYFEEEKELVLLDYKTDKVKDGETLVQKYATQLEYYAKALEQLTGKQVKEKLIYSFTLGKVFRL